jgi:hypothetical protein
MSLQDAFTLFRRLGVNAETMSRAEFDAAYIGLARRYHPDANPSTEELMANINRTRRTILESLQAGLKISSSARGHARRCRRQAGDARRGVLECDRRGWLSVANGIYSVRSRGRHIANC